MPATRAPIRDTKGRSQDPVDFLWRSIKRSKHYSPEQKAHVRVLITQVRRQPWNLERRTMQANHLRSYIESLRTGEAMPTQIPGSHQYKATVWSHTRLGDNMKRMGVNGSSTKDRGSNDVVHRQGPTMWSGSAVTPPPDTLAHTDYAKPTEPTLQSPEPES
jgi:hypothetical protein